MKKKLFATVMSSAMLITALAGCGGGNSSASGDGSDLRIGFSISRREQYVTSMERAATAECKNQGITLEVNDSENDITKQLSHVQIWATQNYDAIIVNLVNTDNGQEIADAANGIPVVFVNMIPDKACLNENVIFIGSDEVVAGRYQAELLAESPALKGKKDVKGIVFEGTLGYQVTTLRTNSCKEGLADLGFNADYVYDDTAEWDRTKAMDKMVQIINAGYEYDFVFCNNDEMALGVAEAYNACNKEIDVPIVGVDATQVACDAIKDGRLYASVFQSAVGQGGGAAKAAIQLAKGEKVEGLGDDYIIYVDFEKVTQDNVQDYIDQYAAQ